MKNKYIIIIIIVLFFSFCSVNRFSLMSNKAYLIKLNRKLGTYAQKNQMWKEAEYRWRRVVELNSEDFRAHNNLAVALEALGKYKEAEKEYKIAIKLSHNNELIRRNYEKFKSGEKGRKKNGNGKKIKY